MLALFHYSEFDGMDAESGGCDQYTVLIAQFMVDS